MTMSLESIGKQIFEALAQGSLPQDYMVWIEPEQDTVMVGTAQIAFAIRRKTIDDGQHIAVAQAVLPHLIEAVNAAERVIRNEGFVPVPTREPSAHIHIVPPKVDLSEVGRPNPEPAA